MNSQTLFRPQAMASQQQEMRGNILLRPGISVIVLTLVLSTWLVAVVCWLFTGRYSHTETVSGWLEPADGITHVYTTEPGAVIREILVSENDIVEHGTPLIRLSRDAVFSDNQSASKLHLAEIDTKRNRLADQYELTRKSQQTQNKRFEKQLSSLLEEHEQLSEMRILINQKIVLLSNQRDALSTLNQQGFSSQQQVQTIDGQLLDQQYLAQQVEREWLTTQRNIDDIKYQQEESLHSYEVQMIGIENKISDLRQNRNQLLAANDIVITAPRKGKVTRLNLKVGQATQSNLPLLVLMPKQNQVSARLLIPVSAAGQISPGQSIKVRYDAFPYTQFGTFDAEIDSVSANLLLPQEIAQTPVSVTGPAYLASARLSQYQIEHLNQRIELRSGMTFAAEITVRERNLMQWLFEPIYSLRGGLL